MALPEAIPILESIEREGKIRYSILEVKFENFYLQTLNSFCKYQLGN